MKTIQIPRVKKVVTVSSITAVMLGVLMIALYVEIPSNRAKVDSNVPSKTRRTIRVKPRALIGREHSAPESDSVRRVQFSYGNRTDFRVALLTAAKRNLPARVKPKANDEQNEQLLETLQREFEVEDYWREVPLQTRQRQDPTLWEMLQQHKGLEEFWGDDSPEPSN